MIFKLFNGWNLESFDLIDQNILKLQRGPFHAYFLSLLFVRPNLIWSKLFSRYIILNSVVESVGDAFLEFKWKLNKNSKVSKFKDVLI